jgi:hypothetical protein
MDWKFWNRKKSDPAGGGQPKSKLSGPKELPQQIGQFLVTHERMDPDWVWSLRCVMRRRADHPSTYDCRVFNPNQTSIQGIRIADYDSLDNHPELVLFQGWFNKENNQVKLQKGAPELAA